MGIFNKTKTPSDPLTSLKREAENAVTRLKAEGATPPQPSAEKQTPLKIAIDYLSRPARAIAGGLKAGFDYRQNNPYQTTTDRFKPDLEQFKAAGLGFMGGLKGKTDFTPADAFLSPKFAEANPKITTGIRLGSAILGDPLTFGGAGAAKLAGGALGRAALTSVAGAPDVALNLERMASLAAPAARALKPVAAAESGLRNVARVFQKGGGNPEFAEDLRLFRARKDTARQDIVDEVKEIIDPLSPEQRANVRRVLDVPSGGPPPAGLTDDPAVAKAVEETRTRVTDWVPQEYAKEGIPLTEIEGYFPRVRQQEGPLDLLKGFFRRRPIKTSDPFTQARKLMRDKPIEEINKEIGREFFREDLGVPLAARKVAAMENIEGRRFLKDVLGKYGKTAEDIAREGLDTLSPEELARVGPNYSALPEGHVWVSPDTGAILRNQDAAKAGAIALPGEIAKPLDGMITAAKNPDEAMRAIESIANQMRRFWGASVTIYRPGFHFNNWVGGVINNYLGGVRNPARYKQAYDVLENKAGEFVTDAGEKITYDQMRQALRQTGTLNSGFSGALEDNFVSSIERTLGESVNPLKSPGKAYAETARRVGRAVENHVRSSLFIDKVLKGETFDQAAKSVIDYHFDYSPEGLDALGRVLKPWVPFYVWVRNNLALQFTEFTKQPQTYVNYDRIRTALAGDPEGRPPYLRDAIPLGELGDRKAVLDLRTPIEDMEEVTKSPIRALASSIDPRVKVPFDAWVYNQNTFTGAPVQRFEGETTPMLGAKVDPRVAYTLRGLSGLPGTLEQVASSSIEEGRVGPKQAIKLGSQFIPGLATYNPDETALSLAYQRNQELGDALRALRQRLGRQPITIPELKKRQGGGILKKR